MPEKLSSLVVGSVSKTKKKKKNTKASILPDNSYEKAELKQSTYLTVASGLHATRAREVACRESRCSCTRVCIRNRHAVTWRYKVAVLLFSCLSKDNSNKRSFVLRCVGLQIFIFIIPVRSANTTRGDSWSSGLARWSAHLLDKQRAVRCKANTHKISGV